MRRGLLLRRIRIDPALGRERVELLPFLSRGPVEIALRCPLTFLIGENGSGKTTLVDGGSQMSKAEARAYYRC
jgi:predicted ATPase